MGDLSSTSLSNCQRVGRGKAVLRFSTLGTRPKGLRPPASNTCLLPVSLRPQACVLQLPDFGSRPLALRLHSRSSVMRGSFEISLNPLQITFTKHLLKCFLTARRWGISAAHPCRNLNAWAEARPYFGFQRLALGQRACGRQPPTTAFSLLACGLRPASFS